MYPLLVLLVALATACGASPPPPTAEATPALPAAQDIVGAGARTISAAPSPDWAVAAAGSVWVSGVGPGLTRYDATTGAPTGEVAVYSVCSSMDRGFGSVWAMSCDYSAPQLVRVDEKTGAETARIALPTRLPAESSVGAGEGTVWVLSADSPRQLVGVDPGTNKPARTLAAPDGAVAVRAGLGSVWVTVSTPGEVVRIDPASGAVAARVAVGRGTSFLALGPDAVWALNSSDGTVSRVDARTNAVGGDDPGRAAVGSPGARSPPRRTRCAVRVTGDAVAVRIDPRTNAVVDRFGPGAGSGGVAIADNSVWITAHDTRTIWRLPR